MKNRLIVRWTMIIVILTTAVSACKDDDNPSPIDPNNPYGAINAWIYDTMDEVYYWTDQLPAESATNDKLDPSDYFYDELVVSADRFSRIYPDFQDLLNGLEGINIEAGYDYQPVQSGPTEVVALIKYVKRGSPADDAGLQRSDIITAVNGQVITTSNYQQVLSQVKENHTITYERFNEVSGQYEPAGDISLNVEVVPENPNLLDTVYTMGDKKIAYFFYTFFSPGPEDTDLYDQEMDAIFGSFKDQGVTDIVVDLRYNLGGAISSATNLASLIAPNVTSSSVFYENVWNDLYQNYIEGLPNGDDILRGKFIEKAGNIGSQLNGPKVYFLVGRETASASELVINGLDPYIDIELIGFQTIGKNVGSIPIEDEDNPDNDYGMLPIVLKTFNSQGLSDYDQGFVPVGENFIDEFDYRWYPVGDIRDPLLKKAIENITGEVLPSSIAGRVQAWEAMTPLQFDGPRTERANLPIIFDNVKIDR
ncbi:S41 family peptidase [Fulvivirga sedimenti]|uniref:PDZ domain-containing protein n=1 Tax=Fulvivirga sedimenti TaxID=2879465 RepID=A0A9X1HXP2_9BACT|nr:S41 family peptidase [Fulvivirga sedimenti]MCA6079225.1 PDZ domain-containing protein [Fulvivirga sedimenti]